MCSHSFFESEYCTKICRSCGLERIHTPKPHEGFTENVPLDHGYSRHHRMNMLLKQLFTPQYYGTPNSEVVANVLMHGPFFDGHDLLDWISRLKVKHKQYQNAHYYFAISNPAYNFHPPPSVETIQAIELSFHRLEHKFTTCNHGYNSFFSYNWLLRKLLRQSNLVFYLQFVKNIKCKKREKVYQKMWDFFMSEDSVEAIPDAFQTNQTRPDVLPARVETPPRAEQFFLDRLLKSYLNRTGFVA